MNVQRLKRSMQDQVQYSNIGPIGTASPMNTATGSIQANVFSGIGMNAVEAAGEIATQRCFKTKRVLANGIATSGTGFGMLVMGPFIQWLLWFYGLTGTFLILSGITLNGIVFGFLIPQSLPDDEEPTEEAVGYSQLQHEKQNNSDKFSKNWTETDLNNTSFSKSKEKINLVSITDDKSDYLSIKDETDDSVPETSGYWRLLKNMYYILYSIGGILTFTVTKAVIGKYGFETSTILLEYG